MAIQGSPDAARRSPGPSFETRTTDSGGETSIIGLDLGYPSYPLEHARPLGIAGHSIDGSAPSSVFVPLRLRRFQCSCPGPELHVALVADARAAQPQRLFDALADALVERGEPVTYTSLQKALQTDRGRGTSDRDLQAPFADWRKRRRYKPHLAALDLPDAAERANADFAARMVRTAARPVEAALPYVAGPDMLLDRIADLEEEVGCLARENRALRAEIAVLRAAPEAPPIEATARRRIQDALGQATRLRWTIARHQDGELVAPESRQHLTVVELGRDQTGNALQHRIARCVPE